MNPSYTVFARFCGNSSGNWRNRLASVSAIARRPWSRQGITSGPARHMRTPSSAQERRNPRPWREKPRDSAGGNEGLGLVGPPGLPPSRSRCRSAGGEMGEVTELTKQDRFSRDFPGNPFGNFVWFYWKTDRMLELHFFQHKVGLLQSWGCVSSIIRWFLRSRCCSSYFTMNLPQPPLFSVIHLVLAYPIGSPQHTEYIILYLYLIFYNPVNMSHTTYYNYMAYQL